MKENLWPYRGATRELLPGPPRLVEGWLFWLFFAAFGPILLDTVGLQAKVLQAQSPAKYTRITKDRYGPVLVAGVFTISAAWTIITRMTPIARMSTTIVE